VGCGLSAADRDGLRIRSLLQPAEVGGPATTLALFFVQLLAHTLHGRSTDGRRY
jgi:hypothetical protein